LATRDAVCGGLHAVDLADLAGVGETAMEEDGLMVARRRENCTDI